jgi:stage V sporulation protein B
MFTTAIEFRDRRTCTEAVCWSPPLFFALTLGGRIGTRLSRLSQRELIEALKRVWACELSYLTNPDNETTIARDFLSSSVVLIAGSLVSSLILSISSIVVARLLGPAQYGLYSLALTLPFFVQILAGAGVSTAITRYASFHLSRGEPIIAKRKTTNGILFLFVFSLALTLVSLFTSGIMSSVFLHRSSIAFYVQIASILIFGTTASTWITTAFLGWGSSLEASFWMIVQAVLKLVFSVILILLGFGILGAVVGTVLAPTIAGVFGTARLYGKKLKITDSQTSQEKSRDFLADFSVDVKEMVRYGFPLYVGNAILTFSQQPYLLFILALLESDVIIGYYSAANVFANSLNVVANFVGLAAFPAFSRLFGAKSDISAAFTYSIRYVSFVVMPLLLFLVETSPTIITSLYGSAYLTGAYYLQFLLVSLLLNAFGLTVLPALFNGVGKTRLTMLMNIAESTATLVPAPLLAFSFHLGVIGVLYALVISNFASTILGLYLAKKYLEATVGYAHLFRTLLTALVCYGVLYALSIKLPRISNLPFFFLEFAIYFALYLTLAPVPLFRIIDSNDIMRLQSASRGLGVLTRIVDLILSYESYLSRKLGQR